MNSCLKIAVVAVAMTGVAGLMMALPASAGAPVSISDVTTTYYSDATHSTIVGRRHYGCDGRLDASGSITPYMSVVALECE